MINCFIVPPQLYYLLYPVCQFSIDMDFNFYYKKSKGDFIMSNNIDNNVNNTINNKPNEKNGLLQNIYFVGFLLILSIADCVRHAINYDYKIVNLIFIAFSAFLLFKIIKNKNQSKS